MDIQPFTGEPDIERLLGAFKHEKIDRVPNFEVLIEDEHVEKLLGRYAGNTLAIGGDPAKGIEEAKSARPMYPKDYIELCQIIGQDAIIVESIWTPFKKLDEKGNKTLIADRSIKNRKDFESVVILPGEEDIEEKRKYIKEYREALRSSGTRIGFTVLLGAFFQTLYEFVIGLEDTMAMVYKQRDFLEELLEISTEYWVNFVRMCVEEGVDFIWPADDVAFKTGLFLPPELMKEIWLPRLSRIISPAVEAGVPVMFHSDGKIDDIVEDLINIGVDCIHPMDPYGIDYRDYKKRFGNKVCLAGNIDIEYPLAHGTPEEIEKDVKEHMEALKPGGGYVACSSHSIVNYIPHENFVAMINAIHKYGVYEEKNWAGYKPEKIERKTEEVKSTRTAKAKEIEKPGGVLGDIYQMVLEGRFEEIKQYIKKAIEEGFDALTIVDGAMTPAIREVGDRFSTGELFLPDLITASYAMQAGMEVLTPYLEKSGGVKSKGKIVIGTIKGDLHDIGKNMVIAMLKQRS